MQTPLAGCNPQSEIYNLDSLAGVLAQLVERLNGIEEVRGSNPLGSSLRSANEHSHQAVRRRVIEVAKLPAVHKSFDRS